MKRTFDLVLAALGLTLGSWVLGLTWLLATWDTGANGFFTQQRVGRYGRLFRVVKLRTMRPGGSDSTVTTEDDSRITALGQFFRRTKLDELPQLINVIRGEMSFVGPRPDVPGYADQLAGDDRLILAVRPGITGPATLKYRNEEALLAEQTDPERYNREVIYPDKVRLNKQYVLDWSFRKDLYYLACTVLGSDIEPTTQTSRSAAERRERPFPARSAPVAAEPASMGVLAGEPSQPAD
jgi:lipopolysaccharide/colanic/teichoic acid biosynthesis glycosyltransferase